MASLYFADQRVQQSATTPTPSSSSPPAAQAESQASSAVGGMSYMGNDGIYDNVTPLPPPNEKTDEISGDVVLDAQVVPIPPGHSGGRTVASDITEETGRGGPSGEVNENPTGSASAGVTNPEANEEQPVENDDEKSSGDGNRCLMIILGVVCCILVAGGAGAGVGIALSGNGNGNDSPPDPPVAPPIETAAPSASIDKDPKPTVPPVAPDPTEPPATLAPVEPTPDLPPPLNDQCSDATAISMVTSTFGTTESATPHPELATCGVEPISPGVWYRVLGNGAVLDASTCGDSDFDTKIAVFSGSSCTSLQCVTENDDADDDECGLQSTATWLSEAGTTYFILVHGFGGEFGNFEFAVRAQPIQNDACEGAIEVMPDGSFIRGSTVPAEVDFVGICDVTVTAPGVWYRFVGTGETLAVHTCSGSDYDTMLTVFQGSCGGLVCVQGNDDFAGCGLNSRVIVDSQVGQSYYVLIHGYADNTGTFHLAVATEDDLYNDKCVDAQTLSPGDYVIGNNEFASFDFTDPFVCGVELNSPTVWYEVRGTGGSLTVSLCDAETKFDTQISVFGRSCFSDGFCVGGNDDSVNEVCGRTSEYTWQSVPFERYLVAIHGFNNETGTFGLLIDDKDDAPTYSSCAEPAGPLPFGEALSIPLTNSATIDQGYLTCGPASGSPVSTTGVWLQAEGDGGVISLSTCENNPSGTSLRVFTGTCETLLCVQASNGDCNVEWESEFGATYYMFVEGPSEGNYELSSTSTAGNPDVCSGAIPLVVNAEVVLGTTLGATVDNDVSFGFCGEDITAGGVWYQVIGEGGIMAVSLCDDQTNYDSKVSVFSGDCDNLVCIGGNDDFTDCGTKSAYSWTPIPGDTYYILVHGYETNTGQFAIQVLSQ